MVGRGSPAPQQLALVRSRGADLSKENGFVPLRRGLWEHVRDGRMSLTEAATFIYICSQADTRNGIWNGSAGALAGELGIPLERRAMYSKRWSKETISGDLRSLDGIAAIRFWCTNFHLPKASTMASS